MAWRAALLISTCKAISFTRLAPERDSSAEDKNVIDNLIESEQHQPLLDDYMVETNATASDVQPAASKEANLLLGDDMNESSALASEPQPAAGEESEDAKIAAWEAQREASEESEQAKATASKSQLLRVQENNMKDDAEECQEVEPESACHDAVDWLRQFGFSRHPEWYPGYSSESTFEEVQAMLHGLGRASCPRPCLGAARAEKPLACQDVVAGECYDAIAWLKSSGIERHPDWYPALGTQSSAAEIQAELFRQEKANCPAPCFMVQKERAAAAARRATVRAGGVDHISSSDCLDAEPDTRCHTAVTYGMNEGISKHPTMYEGLRAGSSFKKVQQYLYLNNLSGCALPCPDAGVDMKTFKRPEELRVRKRVEDMSVKELGDFFSGKWDGYESKMVYGDWQALTTTFEKRQWEPTTTLLFEEQPLPQVDNDSNDVNPETVVEDVTANASASANQEIATVVEDVMANASANQEIANASGIEPLVIEPTSNETAEMANAEVANVTEAEEATNGTAETANVSTEVPQDGDIVDEATPEIANVSTELPQDGDVVDEAAPMIDSFGHEEGITSYEEPRLETREEIEQRIRKQLMDEMHLQTTTVAAPQETEEEMRQRLREELMREFSQTKDQ